MHAVRLAERNTRKCVATWRADSAWHNSHLRGLLQTNWHGGDVLKQEKYDQGAEVDRKTAATEARYDRIALVYDLMEWFIEHLTFRQGRRELWLRVPAGCILEVGFGTGKNMSFYPAGRTGCDYRR